MDMDAGRDDERDYREFVDKFKPRRTTDDCHTPPEIYDVVLGWASARFGFDPSDVVRPFWPGGDYEREAYPPGCVVLDNPPFSLLSRIIDFYLREGVAFFLFAPTLTCLSGRSHVLDVDHIVCHSSVTYENGARVNTSFVTNMETDGTVLESAPDLSDLINEADERRRAAMTRHVPRYEYPDHVITAAKVNWFAAHHTPYRLNRADCAPVAKLDAMGGRGIFGGGLLLSERAAAERAAAERAAAERAAAHRWRLSDRELAIVASLGGGATPVV